jgi:hypothetical protein
VVFRMNATIGTILFPFSVFAVFVFLVRLSAPWYLKRRILKFLDDWDGEAPLDSLLAYLALDKSALRMQENEKAARDMIARLEKDGVLRIVGDTVKKIG